MKVSIGTNIKDGPWGGGNLFAVNLKTYLLNNGHEVVHDLKDDDLDIILITEPRKTSESSAFTHIQVQNYLRFQNSNALVVHRINECDERKGTNFVNKYLIEANKVADQTVFVSRWLKDLYIRQGMNHLRKTVILAGADKEIFNSDNKSVWKEDQKIKLITHHWGANKNKGFDVYEKIDDLMGTEKWKEKIEFTYVGNLPANFNFRNARHITPLSGEKLAKEEEAFIQLKQESLKLTQNVENVEVRSPAAGIVLDIPTVAVGSIVKQGDPLITLVLTNQPMTLEVDVDPKDVSDVKIGIPVSVKLDALPFQQYGDLDGQLSYISQDTYTQSLSGEEGAFYRGRVDIPTKELAGVPADFRLTPGMLASADMKVGERRIITYLTHPIMKGFSSAFSEPD